MKKDMLEIQNHLKEAGFIFQGSEIYGGLSNTWDYGPLGAMLLKNIKDAWWKEFILKEASNYPLDSKILMNPKVWEASGHISNFNDPLVENKNNGKRYRADKVVKQYFPKLNTDALSFSELDKYLEKIKKHDNAKTDWTKVKQFHLMFETNQGITNDSSRKIYLRPETAQGIFINFKNVVRSTRSKLPLGIGQIGKSFRNEVTPGNYIFRTREFEQMELEIFTHPKEANTIYEKYIKKFLNFLLDIGINKKNIKLRKHTKNELAHYAKATTDIEFNFPFGWGELMGISNRSDFDLKQHSKFSKEDLSFRDPITNEVFFPYVIEPSLGLDRLALALLINAYTIDKNNNNRLVLKLNKDIAPYKLAILPLNKKVHSKIAKNLYEKIVDMGISATYDESGSIGKRYRRQDSTGTPFAITIIDETKTKQLVTIRERDTTKQKTISIDDIQKYL